VTLQAGEVIVIHVTGAGGAVGLVVLTVKDATTQVCDELPCGDPYGGGCQSCAVLGDCAAEYHTCERMFECIDFAACHDACADPACVSACADANPVWAGLYDAMFTCMICQQCSVACDGASAGCP
jgi:hypothetical protein